jgi:hypothetical protein
MQLLIDALAASQRLLKHHQDLPMELLFPLFIMQLAQN